MLNESKLLRTLEEQVSVQFTGKVNILATYNRQYLGEIFFKSGDLIQVRFEGESGLKALFSIFIQEHTLNRFDFIIEPEIVDDNMRKIHHPFSVIKNRLSQVLNYHFESQKFRPPENVHILINAEKLDEKLSLDSEEFDLLETLSEWSSPSEIYKNCRLLEHEITMALVRLRKKGVLRILASQQNQHSNDQM